MIHLLGFLFLACLPVLLIGGALAFFGGAGFWIAFLVVGLGLGLLDHFDVIDLSGGSF